MCNHNNFKCSLCCADASTASQGRSYAESSILKPQTRAHHIVLCEECFSGWQLPVPCEHRLWRGQCHCREHTGICDWANVSVCTQLRQLSWQPAHRSIGGHFQQKSQPSFGSKYLTSSLRLVFSIGKTRWKWYVCGTVL